MDSGDSKNKKPDGGRDLLSELFDADEVSKLDSTESGKRSPFDQPTQIDATQSNPKPKGKFVQELDQLLSTTDTALKNPEVSGVEEATEIAKPGLSQSTPPTPAPSAPSPPPTAGKTFEFGDNLFEGILDEGTIADEKINFFEAPASKSIPDHSGSGETIPMDLGGVRDQTILLDKPLDATSAPTSTTSDDPIDRALREAFEGDEKAGGANEDLSVEDHVASLRASMGRAPEAVMPEEDTQSNPGSSEADFVGFENTGQGPAPEISSNDFAEIFSNAAIQVPQASSKKKLKLPGKLIRNLSLAAGLLVVIGIAGAASMRLRSEDGIAGFRLEGFAIVKAYRPPAQDLLKEFEGIYERARLARDSDDPARIEESLGALKSVMERDERNVEAAAAMVEHSAMLSFWLGQGSPWAARYDEALQSLNSLREKIQTLPPTVVGSLERARAWRNLSVRDEAKALQELQAYLQQAGAQDGEAQSLMIQAAMEFNKKDELKNALAKVQDASALKTMRVRLGQAVAKVWSGESAPELETLVAENYLPARVFQMLSQKIGKENARALIAQATQLVESTKSLASLQRKVLEYRGDLYNFLEESERAREDWKTIVDRSPREVRVWMKLADSYQEDAMWEPAIESYRAAQKAGPLELNVTLKFAKLLRLKGKIVEALTLLDQGLGAHPKSAELHYEKGRVQLTIYQDEAAKKSFSKALELDPTLENAILGLAELAMQKKDYTEAESLFKKITSKSGRYAEALQGLAHIAERKNQIQSAEEYYRQALQANPKVESIYPHLVRIYLSQEKDSQAEALVERGLAEMPKSPLLKVSMAKIYQFQTRYKDAVKLLESVHKSYEHLNDVGFALADAYIDDKQFGRTWEILNPLVTKELRDSELLYLRARAFYIDPDSIKFGGSTEAAARLIESAVRQDPENEKYRLMAAQIAFRNQDKSAAFEHIETILRNRPQAAAAYIIKGDLHMDGGEYEKANKSYSDALKLTRFHAPIYKKLGDSFRNVGNTAMAIEYYHKVIRDHPSDAQVHLVLGKLYNEQGKSSLALQMLRKAIDLNPNVAEPYYFVGFILKEAGDRRGAISNFERYLSLEPSSRESATIKDEIYFLKGGTAN